MWETLSVNGWLQALANRINRQAGGSWRDVLPEIFYVTSSGQTVELRMREELRTAIKRCPQLLQVIQTMTVEQIYETYGRYSGGREKYLKLEC